MVSQQSITKLLDHLTAMGGPRESSSDVILRLVSNGRGALVTGIFNKAISLSGSPPPNIQFPDMDAVKAFNAKEQQLEADLGHKYAASVPSGLTVPSGRDREGGGGRPLRVQSSLLTPILTGLPGSVKFEPLHLQPRSLAC